MSFNNRDRSDDPDDESTDDERAAITPEGHCPNCGFDEAEIGRLRNLGRTEEGRGKMFDIDVSRLHIVSCTRCGYSEWYRHMGRADASRDNYYIDQFLE